MEIGAFPLSHDAAEPLGFTITSGSEKLAIVTDTGVVTEEIYAEVRYAVRQLNEWQIPTKRSNDEADCSIDYPIPIKKLS